MEPSSGMATGACEVTSCATADLVDVQQQIGGIVIDADRTRTFELTLRGQPQTSEARRHDHALRPR